METDTGPVKLFVPATVSVIAEPELPAVKLCEAGEMDSAKSGVGFGAELPPHEMSRGARARLAAIDAI